MCVRLRACASTCVPANVIYLRMQKHQILNLYFVVLAMLSRFYTRSVLNGKICRDFLHPFSSLAHLPSAVAIYEVGPR